MARNPAGDARRGVVGNRRAFSIVSEIDFGLHLILPEESLHQGAAFRADDRAGVDVVSRKPALRNLEDELNVARIRRDTRLIVWLHVNDLKNLAARTHVRPRKRHDAIAHRSEEHTSE